eukprot:m.35045 g.35045  ORF g.35045 m.35045 type:complete len:104 (+) comp9983_c1_seq1:84-395(+)
MHVWLTGEVAAATSHPLHHPSCVFVYTRSSTRCKNSFSSRTLSLCETSNPFSCLYSSQSILDLFSVDMDDFFSMVPIIADSAVPLQSIKEYKHKHPKIVQTKE